MQKTRWIQLSERPKIEYKNIQVPKVIIDNALAIMHHFGYRNPHEFIIEHARRGIEKLVKLFYKMEQIKAKNRLKDPQNE